MGNPLNKRLFGDRTLPGLQLVCTAYWQTSMASNNAFIIKQLSSTRFLVGAPDGRTGVCRLWPDMPHDLSTYVPGPSDVGITGVQSARQTENRLTIVAIPYNYLIGSSLYCYVIKIGAHRITMRTHLGQIIESEYITGNYIQEGAVITGPHGPGQYLIRKV